MTDGTFSAIISAASGILGTIVGGFITYLTNKAQKGEDRLNEIRSTAHGIGAELRAYTDLVSMRNHDATVQGLINLLQLGQDVSLSPLAAGNGNARDFFPLFYSRLQDLGALTDEIEDLAKFHTQLAGIYATLTKVQAGALDKAPIAYKISLLQSELALWQNTIALGRAVAQRLLNRA